jgi:hypothetical protein
MKVYKILHKPTGLYFTPSKGYGNLSTSGKIYTSSPNLDRIGESIRLIIQTWDKNKKLSKKDQKIVDHFKITPTNEVYWVDRHFPVPKGDWEIVEF